MKLIAEQIQFYFVIFLELIFFPFLYLYEGIKNLFSSKKQLQIKKIRTDIISKEIYINIHEWGGYASERTKKLKNGKEFNCGLKFQLKRFSNQHDGIKKKIFLTVSDLDLLKQRDSIEKDVDKMWSVSNNGMDFSGYSEFYKLIKNKPNAYVLLTNTSVNAIQTEFLDDYISYMNCNPDVGMMGVSYCSKIWQSLLRNNFNPHLQSFFLLTTTNVLDEIVKKNGGNFPGKGILYKRLLIKKGEIKISKLVQKAGYNLAVSLENGTIFKFGKNGYFDNGYNRWILNYSDGRLTCKNPNIINEIQKD